ncbi:MAG: SAM-dependent DNA methyltransferase [Candidatus Schekmanbacteria bacterium]|nr:SAM-dependent DNA methyltransferase [Candidatus Schekmanbacteria bacterium]
MPVLAEGQRRTLERAVLAARQVAEAGAQAAIRQLAVDAAEPFQALSPADRGLRKRLRARARQLGDTRDAKTGRHGTRHLVVECAYEHWHRMLFARFLAENNVLMHPDGVPVTLAECEELAPEEGTADGWELAASYAAQMLPQVFRPDSPIFELKLPPEKVRELERLLADLPADVFTASDSLGWVYQYWQAKKRDEINASEVRIGADELPAVTQLFTEPYMVQFLLHNTLGAWWVGRHGRDSLPLEMPFLRLREDGTPAAGTFDDWPALAREVKVLDPCCDSGHFLVAAFDMLVRFRMAEEGLDAVAACDAVIRDNVHGLELDEQCTQIAAFALALVAWTFPGAPGYRALPEMRIACSGLAPRAARDDWLALCGNDERLRAGMERLYDAFARAPCLGSLIDPRRLGLQARQRLLGVPSLSEIRHLLRQSMAGESGRPANDEPARSEIGVTAKGLAHAADLLGRSFTLVATNVPFLTRGKQDDVLKDFCREHHDEAKQDLATSMLQRCLTFCAGGGTVAVVTPQNWHMLATYTELRRQLLAQAEWNLVVNLGRAAFRDMNWWAINTALNVLSQKTPDESSACAAIDLENHRVADEKGAAVQTSELRVLPQSSFYENPDHRIVLVPTGRGVLLEAFAAGLQGIATSDYARFGRYFWEVAVDGKTWVFQQSTVREVMPYGGREYALQWDKGRGALASFRGARIQGLQAWGKLGVAISQMRHLPATLYTGEAWDNNTAVILPRDPGDLLAIWAYCSSPEYAEEVRKLDRKANVTNATLVKVPFDAERWRTVAAETFPDGLPEPRSNDPTQWLFRGAVSPSTSPLQVAVARLLGYRWPEQVGDNLDDLIDADGIVCLPAVRGEQPAATRLHRLLARAFGNDWSANKQAELLNALGCAGWTLERWLGERFFRQHCEVFQQRPFIWHIWDGVKSGGFGALVNYHMLDRKLLETLTYNYLGNWIRRQQDGASRREDGADDRLLAARALQEKLKRILEGEPPCDIFVRWKPIEQQPLGWDPDINDGVRIDIRPFMLVGDVGRRGAGILRDKPNINWGKDRGKDPTDAPWFAELGGERINDHHLTLADKLAARAAGVAELAEKV